jgi:CubicO group peptidase (beta-lactamase class C family)
MNFFLNHDQRALPAAPPTAYYHAGAGSNIIYVDPENDLVVVVRWIQQRALGDFIARVLEAIEN